jgi:hypothetical protein
MLDPVTIKLCISRLSSVSKITLLVADPLGDLVLLVGLPPPATTFLSLDMPAGGDPYLTSVGSPD